MRHGDTAGRRQRPETSGGMGPAARPGPGAAECLPERRQKQVLCDPEHSYDGRGTPRPGSIRSVFALLT